MLRTLSEASTGFLERNNVISGEKRNIYVYGFEVIYSTAICFAGILILGWLGHRMLGTLIFLLYFTLIRIFAGGYHAKTYGGCFLATNAAYLLESFLAGLTAPHRFIQWCILLLSVMYIWNRAPVKNPHRQLPEEKRTRNQAKARMCLCASLASMLVFQVSGCTVIMPEVASTLAIVAGMIFITFIT